jgi:uncharacterized membrane protein
LALGAVSTLIALDLVPSALADSYLYTTIDFPGAIETEIGSINNVRQIVGGYELADGTRHGFLLSAGVFSTVDDPSATSGSEALGINLSGQIVGAYNLNSLEGKHVFEGAHGFLYSAGAFADIDFPAASVTNTTATRINDSGAIVGVYRINSGPGNGFLDIAGVYSTVNFPGKVGTHCNGINNAGQIVGQYKDFDGGPHHGFVDSGGTFTSIDFPGAAETRAEAIDNFGNVVGGYRTSAGAELGFLDSGGTFSTIAFPNAVATFAIGINDQGDIVGLYEDQSMVLHGFLATPSGTPETGTIGYWLNHPKVWCMASIQLGCHVYTQAQAIAILKQSTNLDMTYQFAAQLIAAKLNVFCAGTNPGCVSGAIAAADSWLCAHPIGSGVRANSSSWKQITPTYNTLAAYNEGLLCAPPRD